MYSAHNIGGSKGQFIYMQEDKKERKEKDWILCIG